VAGGRRNESQPPPVTGALPQSAAVTGALLTWQRDRPAPSAGGHL